MISNSSRSGIALDVGTKRIGVAGANLEVRFAAPLTTLDNPGNFLDDIVRICKQESAAWIVLGLPRGLHGQETGQTTQVRAFGTSLADALAAAGLQIPVYWADEALTSVRAEAEIQARSGGRGTHRKGEIDALAAVYILEDFLQESGEVRYG